MHARSLFSLFIFLVWLALPVGAAPVEFNRDIRPILSDHCLNCHGQDAGSRKAELRLDVRDEALKGGESGEPAIIPGEPERSELLLRVISHDRDEVMPPPKSKNPVTPEEVAKLRQWIAEGAKYEGHWAFAAPQRRPLPEEATAQHPIDAWVRQRLTAEGLTPSPAASPEALCRRIYLDVIGLPPTPAQVDEFSAAAAKDRKQAVEGLIDALLAMPAFGEKWARPWLDVARYADSDGYEKDLPREQWAWRDWVIAAINRDMPYDEFIVQQIAGDLLPGAQQEQRIATGFLRNSMVNEEGAILAEQFRMESMFDRMDCLGKAVLGVTLQCAQCHTHKFDPISHTEYFQLFAFLNDTYEATSWVYTPEQQQTIARLQAEIAGVDARLQAETPGWQERLAEWGTAQLARRPHWQVLKPLTYEWKGGLAHPQVLPDDSVLTIGFRPTHGELVVETETTLSNFTGLRLEAMKHGDLPFGGPGRSVRGTFAISELVLEIKPKSGGEWKKLEWRGATADFAQADQPLDAFFRKTEKDKDGKEKPDNRRVGPADYLVDGKEETAWGTDRGPGRRHAECEWVGALKEPAGAAEGVQVRVTLKYRHGGADPHGRHNHFLGRFRLALTTEKEPRAEPLAPTVREALTLPLEKRSAEQSAAIFAAWRAHAPEGAAAQAEAEKLWAQYPEGATTVLHLADRAAVDTRKTRMLERGNWEKPAAEVQPGTPAFLHALHKTEEPPRLQLARWLVDRRSPSTARVAVNRVWQTVFGAGLVETADDFGVRAPLPVHRELLDWLAVDFMENGWRLKPLLRLVLTSETYGQTSRTTPELLERDPRNRLLARGPRFRADAEVVRDIALSASGLLTQRVGGPSIFPPVPESLFAASFVPVDFWKTATDAERYRRSLYVFRRRSLPDPVLSSFDAPAGDVACAARPRSNTALGALTSLNETVFLEAARALALRTLREAVTNDDERVAYAFQLCTSRRPTAAESAEVLALLRSQRARIAEGWLSARDVATGDPARLPEALPAGVSPTDAAAWTIVARVLLNLDETLTKG